MARFALRPRHSQVVLAIAMLAAWSASAQQAAPASAATGSAQAATDGSNAQRVEVTALKTRQSLQDVPASVTALTADDLARSGIVNSADLQQKVPGLSLSSGGRETNLAIRGVSNNVRSIGADPSNAVHIDGVYLPRSGMVLTELFDLQRVEVLKGPGDAVRPQRNGRGHQRGDARTHGQAGCRGLLRVRLAGAASHAAGRRWRHR
jgi:iron complex outermembrane receptor protein